MTGYALPIKRLIRELGRLPGIGEKTATRMANHILRLSGEDAVRLAESILDVKRKIRLCRVCFNLAEAERCEICMDPSRDRQTICVVEEPDSLIAIEDSGSFRGTYHVLHRWTVSGRNICGSTNSPNASGRMASRKSFWRPTPTCRENPRPC
jgi:recombination protein RecR